MPKLGPIPGNGYVFDGVAFWRAKVKRDIIVTQETEVPVEGEPSLLVWYTKHEFSNAVARMEAKLDAAGKAVSHNTNLVFPSPELAAELKKATPRLTRDHILHMLTAGIEHARGFAFSADEIAAYNAKADAMVARLEDALLPATAAA